MNIFRLNSFTSVTINFVVNNVINIPQRTMSLHEVLVLINKEFEWLQIIILTEQSESEVECDDDDASVAGQDGAIVRVASVPLEGLAVDKNHDWVLGQIAAGARLLPA